MFKLKSVADNVTNQPTWELMVNSKASGIMVVKTPLGYKVWGTSVYKSTLDAILDYAITLV